MKTFLNTIKTGGRTALIALVLGGAALTAMPAQAAGFSFNFGSGYNNNGVMIHFGNGHFDRNFCLSNNQIRRELQRYGYNQVSIVRNLSRHRVLAVGRKHGNWYQLVVDGCTGQVDHVQKIRRGSNGNFSFSLTFGNDNGYGNGNGHGDGNGDGNGNGNGNGNGHGDGNGNGNGGGQNDDLVCLVTFFDASQVAAGADANVQSARVLPRSRAERIDRPNDRLGIFDYGSDQQTTQTCNELDTLNN